ncbi:MAG: hypothetical protein QM820_46070 [Minicystis sp.]
MRLRAAIAVGATLAAIGCHEAAETSPAGSGTAAAETSPAGSGTAAAVDRIAPLHAFEEERRRATNFARLSPSDHALGPDPFAIRALPGDSARETGHGPGQAARGRARFVGLLRGRDALVLLDESLHEIARAAAPAAPTGIAVADDGEIVVVGEQSPAIASYHVVGDAIRAEPGAPVGPEVRGPGAGSAGPRPVFRPRGLRDVAVLRSRAARVDYAVDERHGTLIAVPRGDRRAGAKIVPACTGAFRVARAGEQLVVGCLIDHALAIFDLDRDGLPADAPRARVQHDGPIWGFDAAATKEGLVIAAGGVEDHPLDRTEGSFGYIDSFVFAYRLAPGATQAEKLAEINVSALGVITPKALLLRSDGGGASVTVAGYGSDRLATITWRGGFAGEPAVATRAILPGVASMAAAGDTIACADPLLDAWFRVDPEPAPVPVPDASPSPRSPASRVGEALFFTNLMAPWNRTEGRLSRFTCETCHFEGYTDGRTHHTGRGDVRATTKPLLGLFNNRPHFTRALDPDMATMVHNEFRVAGARSDHDPWFGAAETGLAWVPLLGVPEAQLDALALRRALMTFLMDFTHRPNPAVLGRDRFDARERRGAEVFAHRCERCHEARLVTDQEASRVPEARWEPLVLSREGPIVWAATGYHKTGVEPYVHDLGARATSLRRLAKKRPYFTNGSAKRLEDVVDRARFQGEGFWHDHGPEGAEAIAEADREALLAFLELL